MSHAGFGGCCQVNLQPRVRHSILVMYCIECRIEHRKKHKGMFAFRPAMTLLFLATGSLQQSTAASVVIAWDILVISLPVSSPVTRHSIQFLDILEQFLARSLMPSVCAPLIGIYMCR